MQFGLGGSHQRQMGITNEKLGVFKTEGVAVVVGVFPWPEEEGKRNNDHVGSGVKRGINNIGRCRDGDALDDRDGNGLD